MSLLPFRKPAPADPLVEALANIFRPAIAQALQQALADLPGLTGTVPAQSAADAGGLDLRDVERAALEAAPAPAEKPAGFKTLAKLAGYSYRSNHFRRAVNDLAERGLLVRYRGGFRRAGTEGRR